MKTKNMINPLLWTLSFTAFLAFNNNLQAGGCDPNSNYPTKCGTVCCRQDLNCCSWNNCCDSTGKNYPGGPPKITAADIVAYAKSKSHPKWAVTREEVAATEASPLTNPEDIEVGTIDNLGDGRFRVNYTIRGVPQSAIIAPK